MGGGFIGGDSSVQWDIFGDNVGHNHESKPRGTKGRRHKGIDQTDEGAKFVVTLKLPAELVEQTPEFVKYTMPIRQRVYDQIEIYWPSSTTASPVKASIAAKAMGTTVRALGTSSGPKQKTSARGTAKRGKPRKGGKRR
jgi:hypothetical protein